MCTLLRAISSNILHYSGFQRLSLTVTEAVAILNNFEQRTGKIITHDQLHDGSLKDLLVDKDYNLKGKVNTHFHLYFPSDSFKTRFITICNLVSKWRRFVVLMIHCTHRCSHLVPRVSYYAPNSLNMSTAGSRRRASRASPNHFRPSETSWTETEAAEMRLLQETHPVFRSSHLR